MQEVLTTEVDPGGMTVADLQIELMIAYGKMPGRTQLYEWLKAAWIVKPQPRGGFKSKQIYEQIDLNRLKRFYELKTDLGTIKAAQEQLLIDIEQNPEIYGE